MLLVDVHKTDTVPRPASASQTLNPCSGSGITGFWAVLQTVLPLWGRAEGVECGAQVLAYDEGENQLRGLIGRRWQGEAPDPWAVMVRAAKDSVGIDLTDGSRFKRVAAIRHRGWYQANSGAPDRSAFWFSPSTVPSSTDSWFD